MSLSLYNTLNDIHQVHYLLSHIFTAYPKYAEKHLTLEVCCAALSKWKTNS